jgi:hypothetical protein
MAYKARFPLRISPPSPTSFVVLSRGQQKFKQKLKILSNCSKRTNFFSGE